MTTTLYSNWRDVPKAKWRWANFSPAEIACRGDGSIKVNEHALDCLQALRDLLGKPMIVLSGYRSPEHNRRVGGARASKHMEGTAFDISMANHDPVAFEAAARKTGFLGFGFYPRSGFMHIDLGPARTWGERFPVRATRFVPETPRARDVLSEGRSMMGGGSAGAATVGVAGVEINEGVISEKKRSLPPLIAYLAPAACRAIGRSFRNLSGRLRPDR